jgi:hypothetical protein
VTEPKRRRHWVSQMLELHITFLCGRPWGSMWKEACCNRYSHDVYREWNRVTLFADLPTASSQRIREKQGVRVI